MYVVRLEDYENHPLQIIQKIKDEDFYMIHGEEQNEEQED